ncbi:MAG TPA: hypothetical protein VJ850_08535 [Candidatus Limnocylindrales bacterium]|nr:hypothetical protein [Candidatus Limnocylindrales bacterium]
MDPTASTAAEWVRPIGDRTSEAIWPSERQYLSGASVEVLDVAEVNLADRRPNEIQPENWVIATPPRWHQLRRAKPADVRPHLHPGDELWVNQSSSSSGVNNRVLPEVAKTLGHSLALVEVNSLEYEVYTNPYNARRKLRAAFAWMGAEYVMDVTDPTLETAYLRRPDGTYPGPGAYLTLSLTSPYRGYCYKLVAAVIPKTGTS